MRAGFHLYLSPNPVFTSLDLRSPVHVVPPLTRKVLISLSTLFRVKAYHTLFHTVNNLTTVLKVPVFHSFAPEFIAYLSRVTATYLTTRSINLFLKYFFGGFFPFFPYNIQHCFIRPSDSTVPTDAGIEPRTVATGALAVRRSNHQARSHPHQARSHPHQAKSHPHQARSHPHQARSHPHQARSHP
jgi:hypothetical protein